MTAPLVTVAPTSAFSPVTVPALWALMACSIFMASMTTMVSPSATSWPSSTGTFTTVPCIDDGRLPWLGLLRVRVVAGVGLDLVVELGLDPLGVDVEGALARGGRGADVGRVAHDRPVEGNDRRHAVDDELVQRPPRTLQGL